MSVEAGLQKAADCGTAEVGALLENARTAGELEDALAGLRACQMRGDVGAEATCGVPELRMDWGRLERIAETRTPLEWLREVAYQPAWRWPVALALVVLLPLVSLEVSRALVLRALSEGTWMWGVTAGVVSLSLVLLTGMSLYVVVAQLKWLRTLVDAQQAWQQAGEEGSWSFWRRGSVLAIVPCAVAATLMLAVLGGEVLSRLEPRLPTWREVDVAGGMRLVDPTCPVEQDGLLREQYEAEVNQETPVSSIVLRQADPQSLNSMGVYLERKKDYGAAQAFYAMAYCIAPNDPRVQFNLRLAEWQKALLVGVEGDQVTSHQVGDEGRRYVAKELLETLQACEAGKPATEFAVMEGDGDAEEFNLRGVASELRGDQKEACRWYMLSIERAPEAPAAVFNLRELMGKCLGYESKE